MPSWHRPRRMARPASPCRSGSRAGPLPRHLRGAAPSQRSLDRKGLKVSEISVSFEFFPPKPGDAAESFWRALSKLEAIRPRFVSVTYGAGGTTRDRTLNTLSMILANSALKPAAHLTCVGASREDVNTVVQDYWNAGIRHIVALRGDPPGGGVGGRFVPHPGGYHNAADLVRGIRELGEFEVSVSAYPEKHPEAVSIEEDLAFLADKVD